MSAVVVGELWGLHPRGEIKKYTKINNNVRK